MACYHPIPARAGAGGAPPRLWPPIGEADITLPCGKCIGCKTDRATQWAVRAEHEASMWRHNSFLTLTYDDEHLPKDQALTPGDLTLFLKRLRKHANSTRSVIDRDSSAGIRYLACGEYGALFARPHYHVLAFNCGFRDAYAIGKSRGHTLYESPELSRLWGAGIANFGKALPSSAAYIAQYSLKKQRLANYVDADGVYRQEPFFRVSTRPAVGAHWLETYATDVQHGYIVGKDGRRHPIPRYYRDQIKERLPELAERVALRIEQHRRTSTGDKRTPQRLADSQTIHTRRKQLMDQR